MRSLVQLQPDPPTIGAIAQLGERLPCTQEVRSSILLGSTTSLLEKELKALEEREFLLLSEDRMPKGCSLKIWEVVFDLMLMSSIQVDQQLA